MENEIQKRLVAMHFDKYASEYEQRTPVQNRMGDTLLNMLPKRKDKNDIASVLELGCGAGTLTAKLLHAYPEASIIANDLSPEMIARSQEKLSCYKNVEFFIGDAENTCNDLAKHGPYDLIISNAVVQWFNRPRDTTKSYLDLLNKKGVLALSTFGPGTFYELRNAFRDAELSFGLQPHSHVHTFLTPGEWEDLVTVNDRERLTINQETYIESFRTVKEFMDSIRKSGASYAAGSNRPTFGKSLFREMTMQYEKQSSSDESTRIKATYDILYIVCKA